MAAEALINLRGRGATDSLLKALGDQSAEVRFFAAFALGELRAREALGSLEEVARRDASVVRGFGSVAEQASKAIIQIRGGK